MRSMPAVISTMKSIARTFPRPCERKLVSEETVESFAEARVDGGVPARRVRPAGDGAVLEDSRIGDRFAGASRVGAEGARESIVLLTNKNNFLPLDKSKLKTVAVIGPASVTPEYGNYYIYTKEQKKVDPLEGLKNRLGDGVEIRSAVGCGITAGQDGR